MSFDRELSQRAWEKVVETQMHFNDICMRIRGLFLTAVVAIVGAVGYALSENILIETKDWTLPVSVVGLFAGWLTCYLFYLMDFKHYHQYLRASVKQGEGLESSMSESWNGATLAIAISKISSEHEFGKSWHHQLMIICRIVTDPRATAKGAGKLHSDGRIQIFYRLPMFFFQWGALLSLVVAIKFDGGNLLGWIFSRGS